MLSWARDAKSRAPFYLPGYRQCVAALSRCFAATAAGVCFGACEVTKEALDEWLAAVENCSSRGFFASRRIWKGCTGRRTLQREALAPRPRTTQYVARMSFGLTSFGSSNVYARAFTATRLRCDLSGHRGPFRPADRIGRTIS